ncbi:transposase [Candidatus Auribacterota bacterium]
MVRIARVIATGHPHHITQRGNNKQIVFIDDEDRRQYLFWLKEYSHRYHTDILAYCLMNNHVHFIAVPHNDNSFSHTFDATHTRYSQYFNKKNNACGHLWQGRYYSCVLAENHFYCALRYVLQNPVRAGNIKKAWDWKWSSARTHMGIVRNDFGLKNIQEMIDIDNWEEYLAEIEKSKELDLLRQNTRNGRPLGNDDFVQNLGNSLGRHLFKKKSGRPKKE